MDVATLYSGICLFVSGVAAVFLIIEIIFRKKR